MRVLDRFTIGSRETPDDIRAAVRTRLAAMGLSPEAVESAEIVVRTDVVDALNRVITRQVELTVVEQGDRAAFAPPPGYARNADGDLIDVRPLA